MSDLVTWLRAQLDEDERVARDASDGGAWRYEGGDSVGAWTLYDEHWTIASLKTYRDDEYDYAARMPAARHPGYVDADANGHHIARHDPARVLAEVAAKRAIIAEAFRHAAKIDGEWGCCHDATTIDAGLCPETPVDEITILRLLAQPYANRPGYQESWRP